LKDYAKLVAPFPWVDSKHIDCICEHLEACFRREIKRLLINIPPGYSKSYLCSRCFPSWGLLKDPTLEFLLTSYGDDLAEEHSSAARQFYSYWAPLITGASVSARSDAVDRWLVDLGPSKLGGGMRACGINSAVTGRRADFAIVDDPYKNYAEASSEANRLSVMNNYKSAIRSRLKPNGVVIIVHTRWVKDDITGELYSDMVDGVGEDFVVLSLPERGVENDPLGREIGEPLWPAYYDDSELVASEKAAGPFFWASQHMQDPESPQGKLFRREWFHYFEIEGNVSQFHYYFVLHSDLGDLRYHQSECVKFQTIDTNGSSATVHDYFVISTWLICPGGEILLFDVYREQINVGEHLSALVAQYEKHEPGCIYVENKTFGTNLISSAESLGYPVIATPAEVDKLTRSITIIAKYRQGMVYHRKNASWSGAIEHEALEFPGGRNDDWVDTASIAGIASIELVSGFFETPLLGGEKRVGAKMGIV
jgi:predicted phage terminase large subunit-like protein